jgi:hypothetical protein
MQTFDVSVNILNDKLLISSAGAKSGAPLKKERTESAPCAEAPHKAGSARCGPSNTALFIGVLQLMVFSIVVSSQTSLSYVHMWKLAGSIILLLVPVCAFLAMPGPRCGSSVRALWFILVLHDVAMCMLMHVAPLIVVLATLVSMVGARTLTFFVDRAQRTVCV